VFAATREGTSVGWRGKMRRVYEQTSIEDEIARKALMSGLLLILLQGLDGILTTIGVERFGVSAEGNPLIRNLMHEMGHLPALGLVKCLAVLIIIALMSYARKLPWINNALGAIGAVYIFVAIIPWTYILFLRPYF